MGAKSLVLIILLIAAMGVVGVLLSQDGITGGAVLNNNRIACYNDNDCNDNIAETLDICKNPGTEYSLCVNKVKK